MIMFLASTQWLQVITALFEIASCGLEGWLDELGELAVQAQGWEFGLQNPHRSPGKAWYANAKMGGDLRITSFQASWENTSSKLKDGLCFIE